MDTLPEELLRLIMVEYLALPAHTAHTAQRAQRAQTAQTAQRAQTVSLSTLSRRFAHVCMVNKDLRKILMDTYTPRQVSVTLTFDELAHLNRYLSTLEDPRRALPGPSSARRLFDTWVGGMDLVGEAHVHRSMKIFTTALEEFCTVVPNALKRLHITAPDHWRDMEFDCEVLAELHGLEELRVDKFGDLFGMRYLPPSIRRLEVGYGGVFEVDVLSSHGISILNLPPHLELEYLRVTKRGTVGVVLRQLIGQAETVDIDCKYLLVGVTVEDPDNAIVSMFRSPFLVGRYVPPHVRWFALIHAYMHTCMYVCLPGVMGPLVLSLCLYNHRSPPPFATMHHAGPERLGYD